MKKNKANYSLTAKERKEQRRRAQEKSGNTANAPITDAPAESGAESGEQVAAPAKRKLWIPITGIVLALVIILTAVLLLVVYVPRSNSSYPRAVIELEDGRKLTLTIWEEECPVAASNFIFLSKIGFFTYSQGDSKGSLFYDVEENHSFMRFGAYYDYSTNAMRQRQDAFLESIPLSKMNVKSENLPDNYEERPLTYKFGYRLYKDSGTAKDRFNEKYVISFNNNEAGDFVINMQEGNSSNFMDKSGNSLRTALVAFGQFEDEASQKVLDEIFALPKEENSGLSQAVGTYPQIRIKRISFKNLSNKKWKNFEFISYMLTALDGGSAFSGWRNS